jgi:hypothetical protein
VSYARDSLDEAGRDGFDGHCGRRLREQRHADVFDTTFSDDTSRYHNEGDANLTDISYHMGLPRFSSS